MGSQKDLGAQSLEKFQAPTGYGPKDQKPNQASLRLKKKSIPKLIIGQQHKELITLSPSRRTQTLAAQHVIRNWQESSGQFSAQNEKHPLPELDPARWPALVSYTLAFSSSLFSPGDLFS